MKDKGILVTATTFPRYKNDNQPTFVKDLSCELAKHGLNVHVLVPHHNNLKYYEKMDNLYIHRFVYFVPKNLERVAYGGLLPNIKKNKFLVLQLPFLFFFQLLNLIKLVKKYKFDTIHSHWVLPQGLSGAITKKILGIRHVLTIHGADLFTILKLPFGKSLIKFVIKNTDTITCVNNEIKNKLNQISNKDKIFVIPMGVNTKDYKSKIISNKNILFLGRLADKKGVNYLLEAARLLEGKDVKFLIAGDGPLKEKLENFVKTHNLKNVKFLGYITGKEKINLIKSCGIFIVPSIITGSGDREGLPVSLLEAMATGKSIITTDVGGIKDIIENNYNGLLIKQKNSEEIVNAINKLIRDKNLAKKIAINARRTVLDYDWRIIGTRYYKILMNEN